MCPNLTPRKQRRKLVLQVYQAVDTRHRAVVGGAQTEVKLRKLLLH